MEAEILRRKKIFKDISSLSCLKDFDNNGNFQLLADDFLFLLIIDNRFVFYYIIYFDCYFPPSSPLNSCRLSCHPDPPLLCISLENKQASKRL